MAAAGPGAPRRLGAPLGLAGAAAPRPAATLVLYAIQASYSEDVSNAIENIGFFLVPFAVLFALLAELEWSRELLRRTLIAVAVVAAGCALVAIYQYFARDLFLNPELFDANQLHVYFRVNSIFFDPNVFGRYLALALTALAACVAWGGDRRDLRARDRDVRARAAGARVQLLADELRRAARRPRHGRGAALALARGGGLRRARPRRAGGAADRRRDADQRHRDRPQHRQRPHRPRQGWPGAVRRARARGAVRRSEPACLRRGRRPIAGDGSGSFGRAFFEHIEQARTTVSHSEPITVAAEQGVIGLVVYGALLVCALATVFGGAAGPRWRARVVAACFVAILLDSFGYTGFVIDPATWALLGLGVALRRDPPEPSATIRE